MTAAAGLSGLWAGVLAATGGASPEPAEVVDTPPPELVTPGTIGFLVTFGVAVALVFLVRDMNRRVRRIRVRAERADEQLRAAEARASGAPGVATADGERPDRPDRSDDADEDPGPPR